LANLAPIGNDDYEKEVKMRGRLTPADARFIVETLLPGRADPELVTERLQADESRLETMLDDEQLFRRVMGEKNILLKISPWLFFTLLLRRTWRDLEREAFTIEQRSQQKVILFDADQVVQLLAPAPVRDYLATMLASFTRVESVTMLVEVKKGRWRGYRTHEFNIEGMIRYSQTLDEPFRFAPYKRIGDVCLFLSGLFPEAINRQTRSPQNGRSRRGSTLQKIEDYEAYGRAFYRLAAEHEQARRENIAEVLARLSENFILAEKPLSFLATRYLQFVRHNLFEM
jgi:hypothetical protein